MSAALCPVNSSSTSSKYFRTERLIEGFVFDLRRETTHVIPDGPGRADWPKWEINTWKRELANSGIDLEDMPVVPASENL